MSTKLIIIIIIFTLFMFGFLMKLINDKKLSVKYSLIWILPLSLFLVATIIPNLVDWFAKLLGFQTMVSFIFSILFAFLLLICLSLTIIVSKLRNRQKLIIQELSILKTKISNSKR